MPRTVLGKVSLTPRGAYSEEVFYTALDLVSYNGSGYIALKNVQGVAPSNDDVNWMLLASKGDTGETGPQGVSVIGAEINESGNLIITLDAGEPINAGSAVGPKGDTGDTGATGPQGVSIDRIERTSGSGASGSTDTYTVYLTDGSTAGTFQVYNGADATGTGDFKADGTVPMAGNLQMGGNRITGVGSAQEETDAVNKGDLEEAIAGVTITTDASPTEGSVNPVQSGGVYAALSNKADLTLSNLSDRQKALANLGGRPRQKLFYNWYFAGGGSQQGGVQFPINQLGQTTYANSGSSDMPCIDGAFIAPGTTLEIEESGILISTGSDTKDYYFGKNIISDGSPYTFSVFAGAFTGPVAPRLSVQQIGGDWTIYGSKELSANAITSIAVSVPKGTKFRVMVFWPTGPNCTAEIIAMGAEHGDGQTLGYQDSSGAWNLFETPDYLETLQQCRRYLYATPGGPINCAGAFSAAGLAFGLTIPVGVEMAKTLNISYSSLIGYGSDGVVFNSNVGDTFTPSAIKPVGNTVYVYGALGAQSSAASQGFTATLGGLVITGTD